VLAWFVLTMQEEFRLINDNYTPRSHAFIAEAGGIIFIAAWLWSLVTSIKILQTAKKNEQEATKNPPPRIE
jgi:hypothetical protein